MPRKTPNTKPSQQRGRPPIEGLERVNVTLRAEQLSYLAELGRSMAAKGKEWQPVTRSEILRAAIDAIRAANLDLSECEDEADIAAVLTRKLKSRN
jgi:hypothetical protein